MTEEDLVCCRERISTATSLKYLNIENLSGPTFIRLENSCQEIVSLKSVPCTSLPHFLDMIEHRKETLQELEINSEYTFQLPFEIIPQCQDLTLLTINSADFISFEILPLLKNLTTLQLKVEQSAVIQISYTMFKQKLPPHSLPRLENIQFNVVGNLTESFGTKYFIVFASASPNLKTMKFQGNEKNVLAATLAHFIDSCPKLEAIITPPILNCSKIFWKVWKKLPNLELIYMSDPFFEGRLSKAPSYLISEKVIESLFDNCKNLIAVVQHFIINVKFEESHLKYEQPLHSWECPVPYMEFQNIYDLLKKHDLYHFSDFMGTMVHHQHTERLSNALWCRHYHSI